MKLSSVDCYLDWPASIKVKKLMNIIFYFAFIGFGFGAAFALDKLLRAVKLI